MKLSLQSRQNGIVRLRVEGRVSQRDVILDAEPLTSLLGDDAYHATILLDMSEVAALDSSGVNWLLISQKKTREAGGKLVLHSLSPIAKNVIRVLNLQTVFTMAESATEALSIVGGESK
jgi:anti-anti-sigma factor